jgi:hypothetical protein
MAAKTDQVIILPLDTGNTGKSIRAKQSVVGANTVQEYFFIPSSERSETGRYKVAVPAAAIPTAAQTGTTTGMAYLTNPLASTVKLAVSRMELSQNFSTTLGVDLIAPLIRVSRISFTGTLSAATTASAKRATADATAQGLVSIAMTGLTVAIVAGILEFVGQTEDLITGGGGHWPAQVDSWTPDEEGDEIVLAAGEGIAVWSSLAVTTANRKLAVNLAWKEFN